MRIYGEENQIREIKGKIDGLREAAGRIKEVKPIINKFDGKMYNKNFNEAIRALTDDGGYFGASNQYRWFIISYASKTGEYRSNVTLLSGYSCKGSDLIPEDRWNEESEVFDGKRINAAKMINNLDRHYQELLKQAYDLEKALEELPRIRQQIQVIEKAYNGLVASIPYEIMDVCGIKRYF